MHDQLHALCLGPTAPGGHGRALKVDSVIGQAVLDCAAARLGRSMARWRALSADIAAVDGEIAALLPGSDGQVLTTLP